MATHRRCPECREFYCMIDSKICPDCGKGPKFNKSLRTASLNNNLYQQAASQ